jgi:hypothetical protein
MEPTNISIYWLYKMGGKLNKMKVKNFQHDVTYSNLFICYEQKMV